LYSIHLKWKDKTYYIEIGFIFLIQIKALEIETAEPETSTLDATNITLDISEEKINIAIEIS
jgi:hypothetical protein